MEMAMGYFTKGGKMKLFLKLVFLFLLLNNSVLAKQCIMNKLNKYDNAKKINIEKMQSRYKNNKQEYKDVYGNDVIEQLLSETEYRKFISIPNTPYLVEKRFNNNGALYYFTKSLKGMNFGNIKTYDKNDKKLLRNKDLDQEFKFDLCSLIKMMNQKYNRNIEDKNVLFSLERWNDTEKYKKFIYEVVVRNPDYTLTEYIIDGTTGEILNVAPRIEYLN